MSAECKHLRDENSVGPDCGCHEGACSLGVSGRDANQPMPQYGIDRDYPLLSEKARQYDFAERLGGCSDPMMAEIDAAMREVWNSRRHRAEFLAAANRIPREEDA